MIKSFFKKWKFFFVPLLILLILTLVGNFIYVGEDFLGKLTLPFYRGVTYLSFSLKNLFISQEEENQQKLRQELLILQAKLARYKEKENLYHKLEEFFRISRGIPYPKVASQIIYESFYPFGSVIYIDRGKKDGILPQMPVVVAYNGKAVALVGEVVEVFDSWSKVILLTDPSFSADVKLVDSGVRGIVRGKAEPLCDVDYIPFYKKVKEGDLVITSGKDGVFPRGLYVGQIVKVYNNVKISGVFKRAELKPAVNFYDLDVVFVILKKPLFNFETEERYQ